VNQDILREIKALIEKRGECTLQEALTCERDGFGKFVERAKVF